MKVVTFPQHATKPATKPATITDILDATEGITPEQMLAVVAAKFPHMTMAELRRAIKEHVEQLRAEAVHLQSEAHTMEDIEDLCKPVFDTGGAETIGDALVILAEQGDEGAAALLAQMNAPEQQEFWRLMDLAVEADPYWSRRADGRGYKVKRRARYTTPEYLVAAYKRNHGAAWGRPPRA